MKELEYMELQVDMAALDEEKTHFNPDEPPHVPRAVDEPIVDDLTGDPVDLFLDL